MQQFHFQEKLTLILEDFERQLDNLEKLSFQISIHNKYSYSFLDEQAYNEAVLLRDFESYQDTSVLAKDLFLYYYDHDRDNVFHTSGNKVKLDVYLRYLSKNEAQILKDALAAPQEEPELFAFSEGIYLLIPFYTLDIPRGQTAILGSLITYSELYKRFELVSGGMDGKLSFYMGNDLLFCNQDTACSKDDKKVQTAVTEDGIFSICYLPQEEIFSYNSILLQAFFLLADVLLLLVLAHIFAGRAYKPIQEIKWKYKNTETLLSSKECKNAFEEIENIINQALQNSALANQQVQQKQELLKQQILRLLLNGTYFPDILTYLDKLDISMPGPFYYVICIAYSEEVNTDFLTRIQKELEQIVMENRSERVYAVCDKKTRQLWTICTLTDRDNEAELTEYVLSIAQSYSYEPAIGIGEIYTTLSRVSASWLESIENLSHQQETRGRKNESTFVYYHSDLQWMENTLGIGDEQAALDMLKIYVQHLKDHQLSFLIQQYVFAEFIGEVGRLSKHSGVELSSQTVSLLVSSKNIVEFYEAASELIREYCKKFHFLAQERSSNETGRIFEYMKEHFTEYSLSIETVAEDLGMTNIAVREAVFQATGKKYKDYLLDLRIEYAKKLLREESLTVAEVCTRVGFVSVSYFITSFKESTGVTPAKYMKAQQLKKLSAVNPKNPLPTHK